ncbi:MAG: OmpH family outer membrane protein [Candidatus Eisenbacteria bacterium]|nr:OmpH family outer membrane protein [Candidatus Eisenbacteria bacterium]
MSTRTSRPWILGFCATLAAVAIAASAARALDVRIGYVDSARIFREYPAAQEAQKRFDRQVQGWRDEAADREKTVKKVRDEVRDQAAILSSLKRQEKEEDLQRKINDYEQFIQETWGPQGRAVRENEQATGEVVAQIRSAVEKVAAGKGLLLVFDSASGAIVYADHSLDLTRDVLDELSSRLEPGKSH